MHIERLPSTTDRFKVGYSHGSGYIVKTASRWDTRNIGFSRWVATFATRRHAYEYCDLLNGDNGFADEVLRGELANAH